jgi:hypothetical protein
MLKRILKSSLVLAVVALSVAALLGSTVERRAVVTSEPLSCVAQGDTLVCFDGVPGPAMVCRTLDAHDVLCSS